jgi:Tfp pilus assembly protein PilF
MSLLLEALKKAELAKQAAKEAPSGSDAPPFTRDQLPDITQPMEIHSEDLSLAESEPAPKRANKPVLELALEEPAPPSRATAAGAGFSHSGEASYSPSDESMERKQAQQLFEAKELDVNPRKPFYITVSALGVFALGTIGYFWYQLQPRSAFTRPPTSAQAVPPPPPTAPPVPASLPDARTAATGTPPTGMQPAEPVATMPARRAEPVSAPITPAPAKPKTVFVRQTETSPAPDATAPQRSSGRREGNITITPARVQADPILDGAFAAFNAGDLAKAREDYQQVLRYSPDSRDALLGLAAVETLAKHQDAAERYYVRLLELDPRDALAQSGLIGLRGQADPLAAESRLKSMIASQPGVGFLHFTLGNQYALQGRWAEAQQAYFQAFTNDPEQPDFAFNLAVSLDRMHQTKPALEYYRRALALAGDRPVSFDKARIGKRVLQLDR